MERKGIETVEVYVVFLLFNRSKNNTVFVLRTGNFRRLVGFEAKVKYFKICPQGQGRPQRLHLCYSHSAQ